MKKSRQSNEHPLFVPLVAWCWLGLIFWLILLWAQPPSIPMDDSGEMIAASWNLGLPHPPGYPLFNLLGHLFSRLPVGTVAFRFGLMSTMIILFSLALILKSCAELTDRLKLKRQGSGYLGEILLMLAALFFLSCRTVFAQSLSAKGSVYALTLLLVSVLIWIRVSGCKKNGIDLAWFLWALGLANHWQTVILLAPFLIFMTLRGTAFAVKKGIFTCFFSILGLSLYLYLPLRAALLAQPSWGFPLHWTEFKWVVFRQLVAGEEMRVHPFSFYGEALEAIFQSYQVWMPGIFAATAAGLFVLYRFEKKLFLDFLAVLLPVVAALAAVHEANNLYLISVYLLPLSGLVVLLGFIGLFWLLSKGGHLFQKTLAIILLLFSVFWCWNCFELESRSRYTLAEDFGMNVLKCLPRGAVLLADGDNYVMPLWYAKYVEGLRPDVVIEPTVFLYHEWGWDQLGFQAEDLKTVPSPPHLEERWMDLIKNPNHHFFYSFGHQFFPSELNSIGHWSPHGLTDGWTASPLMAGGDDEAGWSTVERFRGIEENRDAAMEDPPTHDLYASYAVQSMNESTWYLNHHDELKALSRLESALYFEPRLPGVYADMASIVASMGYRGMAENLCRMSIEANSKFGLSYALLTRIDKESKRDKAPRDYGHLSEILEKAGCPFLSGLAFQRSGPGTKTLN
jgi:hypothetical protein